MGTPRHSEQEESRKRDPEAARRDQEAALRDRAAAQRDRDFPDDARAEQRDQEAEQRDPVAECGASEPIRGEQPRRRDPDHALRGLRSWSLARRAPSAIVSNLAQAML